MRTMARLCVQKVGGVKDFHETYLKNKRKEDIDLLFVFPYICFLAVAGSFD